MMNVRWFIRYATVFIEVLWLKLGQKIDFLVHFERVFVYALWHPMSYAPRFCQMKEFIEIHIRGKFHQFSICGCEVKNFHIFLYWFTIHEITPFWGFLFSVTPPNIVRSCWNFYQRLSPIKQTPFEKFFKILHFGSNRTRTKFTVLVPFGAHFTAGKPKILLKTKISAKTTSLGISNSVSPGPRKITELLRN